jgi:5-(carboxyamino)imidazole ribonucleotide synthase
MSDQETKPLLPAANPSTWLGVMGGGQLGRMFAHAAQAMGYKVAVLEPSSDCPAGQVAERLVEAGYTDAAGLDALAAQCAAVTTEFENSKCSWPRTRMACRWPRTASPRNPSLSPAPTNPA